MCGVAGVYHYADPESVVDRAALVRMTRSLRHRGPDGEGIYIAGPIGLGHRRLSIVDLNETGNQPMTTSRGNAISYNGEFYNHLTFRAGLQAKGVTFRGSSDTETLLRVLEVRGPRALEGVAGIFAFAYWNPQHGRLILARDQLGVKQIYYHDDGKRIVFASEIKALLHYPGVPRAVEPNAVNEYIHFHTPLFERTFFQNIRQVRAAEYLEVTRHGAWARKDWHLDGFAPREGSREEQTEELRSVLQEVVADQLMSDVPVGAFFSGGIDSSAIVAFAKRAGSRLPCFGVHFSGQGVVDERPFQESAARALGVDLHLITSDGSTFPEDMAKLTYFQDQPVVGAALLPMYYVSRLAASQVKVCLGGQAADELFGGYARYALTSPLSILARSAGEGTASMHGNLVKQLIDLPNLRRLLRGAAYAHDWQKRYFSHLAGPYSEREWRNVIVHPDFLDRGAARRTFDEGIDSCVSGQRGDKVLAWDVQAYLTALFQQDDRMSMANSLESRVPFADPRVVRFAFHTPFNLKVRRGSSKWILREAVANILPTQVIERRKVGFDTPAERWMRDSHMGFVRDTMLSRSARERGWWNSNAIERLLDDSSTVGWFGRVWKTLSIELWAQTFLDGTNVASELGSDHAAAA